MPKKRFTIPRKKIADFCQRWQVSEFSVFGSAIRKDFGPKSDVDVLVVFEPRRKSVYSKWPGYRLNFKLCSVGLLIWWKRRDFVTHTVDAKF